MIFEAQPDEAPTAERYRVVLEHCPECGQTEGMDSSIGDTIGAEACCEHGDGRRYTHVPHAGCWTSYVGQPPDSLAQVGAG